MFNIHMTLMTLGLALCLIATVYNAIVTLFERGIKWDTTFTGVGIIGCLMMIAGILTLLP